MTSTWVDILHNERGAQRTLGLDRASRDALATYCRQTFPSNTAKHVAREWSLSLDEARGVVAGRASQSTIDKIFKHRNGGWRVVLPVLGAVIGHGVDAFFREQIRQAAREAALAEEHERMAREAYRRLENPAADPRQDREARSAAGAMGSDEARSVSAPLTSRAGGRP